MIRKIKFNIRLLTVFLVLLPFYSHAEITVAPESNIDGAATVKDDSINQLISDELAKNDISENIKLDIKGFDKGIPLSQLHENYNVNLADFSVNKKNRRFIANVEFSAGEYKENVEVTGRYEEMVKIPVLNTKLENKSVIISDNIEFAEVPKSSLHADVVQDETLLIGMILKRSMREMTPIRARDILKEQIVAKNNVVNMLYKTEFITLQVNGVAIEDGAKGDLVRVRNSTSNKIVKAKIEDINTVVVSPENL